MLGTKWHDAAEDESVYILDQPERTQRLHQLLERRRCRHTKRYATLVRIYGRVKRFVGLLCRHLFQPSLNRAPESMHCGTKLRRELVRRQHAL